MSCALLGNFLVGQLTPVMLKGLGSSGTFWVFALCCSPALWLTWKLIPETKGRSLENIETYWKETYDNTPGRVRSSLSIKNE